MSSLACAHVAVLLPPHKNSSELTETRAPAAPMRRDSRGRLTTGRAAGFGQTSEGTSLAATQDALWSISASPRCGQTRSFDWPRAR